MQLEKGKYSLHWPFSGNHWSFKSFCDTSLCTETDASLNALFSCIHREEFESEPVHNFMILSSYLYEPAPPAPHKFICFESSIFIWSVHSIWILWLLDTNFEDGLVIHYVLMDCSYPVQFSFFSFFFFIIRKSRDTWFDTILCWIADPSARRLFTD